MAMASSLDQIGPITNTVKDAAWILQAIEGNDDKDATSAKLSERTIPDLLPEDIKGMRIGIPKEYFIDGMDEDIRKSVMESVELLEKGGAEIKEISLPNTEHALATYYVIMPCEVSSNLARYDGVRYGYHRSGEGLIDTYNRSRGEGFGDEAKRRIMLGTFALSKGYYDAYYKKALKVRRLIQRDFDNAFYDVDVILTPTAPTTAWGLGEKFNDPMTMYLSDIYTISANLATIPAMSIPCGFKENLPIGMQLLAKRFDEASLFRLGSYYQNITEWHKKAPGEK
jgi:aspartyl-tRNA(Asn)/glutamyl-tRNA(Gln) amidotransferase subunit A